MLLARTPHDLRWSVGLSPADLLQNVVAGFKCASHLALAASRSLNKDSSIASWICRGSSFPIYGLSSRTRDLMTSMLGLP